MAGNTPGISIDTDLETVVAIVNEPVLMNSNNYISL